MQAHLQYYFCYVNIDPMKKLAKIRKQRGMSQTALAAALRTSQAAVCKWERGVNTPHPNTLTRIAQALACKEIELI